jgi:hypothetical protein
MSQTLLTIEYKGLTIIAISKKGSVLVEDIVNAQKYWITRRVFMRLIGLGRLDGVISSLPVSNEGKPGIQMLMVLSPF